MIKNKDRDIYWDVIRGIAVILMLVGHSLQYGNGLDYLIQKTYQENVLFLLIYSFHMPLFMMISGYFFFKTSEEKSISNIIKSKFLSLIIPVIVFSLLSYSYTGKDTFSLIYYFIRYATSNLWFLWALFYSCVLTIVIKRTAGLRLWILIILFILLFFMTDDFCIKYLKFLYPSFIFGYMLRKYEIKEVTRKQILRILMAIVPVYIFLYAFFTKEMLIYNTGFSVYDSLDMPILIYRNIVRWLIGISGAVIVLLLIKLIFARKPDCIVFRIVSFIGVNSLGIYCFQDLLLKIIVKYEFFLHGPSSVSVPMTFILLLLASIVCTLIIKKTPLLCKLF